MWSLDWSKKNMSTYLEGQAGEWRMAEQVSPFSNLGVDSAKLYVNCSKLPRRSKSSQQLLSRIDNPTVISILQCNDQVELFPSRNSFET